MKQYYCYLTRKNFNTALKKSNCNLKEGFFKVLHFAVLGARGEGKSIYIFAYISMADQPGDWFHSS